MPCILQTISALLLTPSLTSNLLYIFRGYLFFKVVVVVVVVVSYMEIFAWGFLYTLLFCTRILNKRDVIHINLICNGV